MEKLCNAYLSKFIVVLFINSSVHYFAQPSMVSKFRLHGVLDLQAREIRSDIM